MLNLYNPVRIGIRAIVGTGAILTAVPQGMFNIPFVDAVLVKARSYWSPLDATFQHFAIHESGLDNKYLFSYLILTLVVGLVTVPACAIAFIRARNGVKCIGIKDDSTAAATAALSSVLILIWQGFFFLKKPALGRDLFLPLIDSVIWLGFFLATVAFFTWLGRNADHNN